MHLPDNNPGLAANELELTDAEREAMTPPAAEGDKPNTTPPADKPLEEGTPAAAAAPPAGATGETPPVPAAAGEGGEPAAAPTPPPAEQKQPAPTPFTMQLPNVDRNFDTELADVNQQLAQLKAQYKGGDSDMTDEAYEAEFERLQDLKGDIRAAASTAALRQEFNQQSQDASWAWQQRHFLAATENAQLVSNRLLFGAWERAMQDAVDDAAQQGQTLTDWEVMQQGRQRLVDAGLMAGAAASAAPPPQTAAATAPPKPDRTPPLKDVPPTLSGVPSAADIGSRSSAEELSTSDIEDLETRLAGMSDAQREALLRGVPGGFLDT